MEFTIQPEFEEVEVGRYTGLLKAVEELPPTAANPTWGSSLLWKFEIMNDCKFKGKEVVAFTPSVPKENNNLGKLLRQLMGRKLQAQEKVVLDPLLNKQYQVMVDLNSTGTKTRVISAHPVSGAVTPGAATAPPAPKMAALAAAIAPPAPSAPKPPTPATAPPVVKQPVNSQKDFANNKLWCFCSFDGGPSSEVLVGKLKQDVVSGLIDSSKLQAYIPDTGEWIPWALVDMPF
jgi:hypothetical protein